MGSDSFTFMGDLIVFLLFAIMIGGPAYSIWYYIYHPDAIERRLERKVWKQGKEARKRAQRERIELLKRELDKKPN